MATLLLFLGPLIDLLGKIPGAIFNLPFGSIFSSIGTFLGGLFKNIVQYWYIWLIAVLFAGNGFFYWEWRHTDAALKSERAAYAAQAASFKNAQAVANAQANAERAVLQKESKANADQADASYATLLAKYHASLLRYSTSSSGTSQAGDSQLPTPQGSDGPSTGAELPPTLTITGDDAQICAVNTARLQAVQTWALQLEKDAQSNGTPTQ